MKKIVFTRPDGGVSVVTPTTQDLLQRAFDAIPREYSPRIIEEDEVPDDRKYRDAWTVTSGAISIDATKKAIIDSKEGK